MMDTLRRAISSRLPYFLRSRPLPRSHRGHLGGCVCSSEVTVTLLHPPRLCRLTVQPTVILSKTHRFSLSLTSHHTHTSLALRSSAALYLFALSACACRFEVTVTSVSHPPFISRRGLSNTNQRLSPSVSVASRSFSYKPTSLSQDPGRRHLTKRTMRSLVRHGRSLHQNDVIHCISQGMQTEGLLRGRGSASRIGLGPR